MFRCCLLAGLVAESALSGAALKAGNDEPVPPRDLLVGTWQYPVAGKNKPDVILLMKFGKDGRGSLTLLHDTQNELRPFTYTVVTIGVNTVVDVKGKAFPKGSRFSLGLVSEKTLFVREAPRLFSPWFAENEANVCGGWFRLTEE
jgi:hypothetical protein